MQSRQHGPESQTNVSYILQNPCHGEGFSLKCLCLGYIRLTTVVQNERSKLCSKRLPTFCDKGNVVYISSLLTHLPQKLDSGWLAFTTL